MVNHSKYIIIHTGLWIYPSKAKLHFRFSDTDNSNQGYDPQMNLVVNQKYHIRFVLLNNKAELFIDDVLVSSKSNVIHTTRYRAPIFVGDPWYDAANVKIGNLKIRQP